MNKTVQMAFVAALALATAGCAVMTNSDHDTYQDEEYSAYAAQRNGTAHALDELGWSPSKTLTSEERDELETRIRLDRLERDIPTRKEREQYYGYRPYFQNDEDRISFLELPSMEARERFAAQRGVTLHGGAMSPAVKDAVSRSDIILGMDKDAVTESWGEPQEVEVAGNAMYGNERWTYTEYVASADGYQKEERVVIFEGGRVVGWQRESDDQ